MTRSEEQVNRRSKWADKEKKIKQVFLGDVFMSLWKAVMPNMLLISSSFIRHARPPPQKMAIYSRLAVQACHYDLYLHLLLGGNL